MELTGPNQNSKIMPVHFTGIISHSRSILFAFVHDLQQVVLKTQEKHEKFLQQLETKIKQT